MEVIERDLVVYQGGDGRRPYLDWFLGLRDERARQIIQARLGRVRLGNFGFACSVGEGVCELKIDYGPGYRVYFGIEGKEIVILLCGGDKSSQDPDIRRAKLLWKEYKKENGYANG